MSSFHQISFEFLDPNVISEKVWGIEVDEDLLQLFWALRVLYYRVVEGVQAAGPERPSLHQSHRFLHNEDSGQS